MEEHARKKLYECFGNIEERRRHTFISFDIFDFYHSISEHLLAKT
jgi:hypothetical protein